MKILSMTVISAILAGLLAGCAEYTPRLDAERAKEPDPRDAYSKKVKMFILNYVPAEDKIPVEYMPEWRDKKDYPARVAVIRNIYENIGMFRSSKKWNDLTLVYDSADGNRKFSLSASRKGAKLDLRVLNAGKKDPLFAVSAEIPEVIQMPGSIPAELEESVSREMNMIFQFLMNPQALAKTVSVKAHPLMNVVTKSITDEFQEFRIQTGKNDVFCYRFEVALKELYSGSLMYLYVSTDPKHDLYQIDISDLAMNSGSKGAFSVLLENYTQFNDFFIPKNIIYNGETFTLNETESSIELMPPAEEPADAKGAEKKDDKAPAASPETSAKKNVKKEAEKEEDEKSKDDDTSSKEEEESEDE